MINTLLFAAFTTVGEHTSDAQTIYQQFDEMFDDWCDDLSFTFIEDFADNFKAVFEYAATNPLCVMFISVLLVVMGFHLCPLIFRSFRR